MHLFWSEFRWLENLGSPHSNKVPSPYFFSTNPWRSFCLPEHTIVFLLCFLTNRTSSSCQKKIATPIFSFASSSRERNTYFIPSHEYMWFLKTNNQKPNSNIWQFLCYHTLPKLSRPTTVSSAVHSDSPPQPYPLHRIPMASTLEGIDLGHNFFRKLNNTYAKENHMRNTKTLIIMLISKETRTIIKHLDIQWYG
jgi:hypothetical protein